MHGRLSRAVLICLLSVAACTTQRPVVYLPSTTGSGAEQSARTDVDECLTTARQLTAGSRSTDVARETLIGGTVGGAAGAAGGAVYGNAGKGAAAGAAGGAAAAFMNRLLRPRPPSPVLRTATSTCLQDRGYRVIGWE